nr:MAG TPA: hypothetical protein [Caudoviricetes sp.]
MKIRSELNSILFFILRLSYWPLRISESDEEISPFRFMSYVSSPTTISRFFLTLSYYQDK